MTISGTIKSAAGALVAGETGHCIAGGHDDVLERRLGSFSETQLAADPGLCLSAAVRHLTCGEGHLAEHWAALAVPPAALRYVGTVRAASTLVTADVTGAPAPAPGAGASTGTVAVTGGTNVNVVTSSSPRSLASGLTCAFAPMAKPDSASSFATGWNGTGMVESTRATAASAAW